MEYLSGGLILLNYCREGFTNHSIIGDLLIHNNTFVGDRVVAMTFPLIRIYSWENVTISNNFFYTFFSSEDSFETSVEIRSHDTCELLEDDGVVKSIKTMNNMFL